MRKLTRILSVCLACAAVLFLAACQQARQEEDLEFRIGLLEPVSTPLRFTGYRLAGARVDELNAAGGLEVGGRKLKVRLIVVDSGGSTEQTMAGMTRLIQQERVSAIIGPYYSRDALPVAAALETLRVPMLSPSATNPAVTKGRSFAFRVCQVDSEQGQVLAATAYDDMKLRRAAVLFDESDAYSADLAGYFRTAFLARQGAQVLLEPYQGGAKDYGAQLARIRAFGAQVLLLPNFPPDLVPQLQQARAAGYAGRFLGGDSWDADHGFHSLPEAQGALYDTDFAPAAADAKLLAAAQELSKRSGAALGKNTALTLDALELLFAAARNVGSTDPVSLRSGLAGLKNVEGLTGRVSYTGGGDPERSVFIMEISGGKALLRAHLQPTRK